MRVSELMSRDVVTIGDTDTCHEAVEQMCRRKVRTCRCWIARARSSVSSPIAMSGTACSLPTSTGRSERFRRRPAGAAATIAREIAVRERLGRGARRLRCRLTPYGQRRKQCLARSHLSLKRAPDGVFRVRVPRL